ncbi:MAG: hypothetical protein R2880_05110 [Deinococcales bacterium]
MNSSDQPAANPANNPAKAMSARSSPNAVNLPEIEDKLWASTFSEARPMPSIEEAKDFKEQSFAEGGETLRWWGDFELEVGRMAWWKLGPSQVVVQRLEQEWKLIYLAGEDLLDSTILMEMPLSYNFYDKLKDYESQEKKSSIRRYMFKESSRLLSLRPLLGDRPFVVKPETPFSIQEGQEVTLYVTTPLWVSVRVGLQGEQLLREMPSHRPSDTWFGDNLHGELCYASRLAGQLSIDKLKRRPYRIVSPLRVRNHSHSPLLIERVKLPVQYLSLYCAKDGFLWTQGLTMTRQHDRTQMDLDRSFPKEMGEGEKLAGPREMISNRGLFGRFRWGFR